MQLAAQAVPAGTDSDSRRALIWFFLLAFGVPWIGWTTLAIMKVQLGTAPIAQMA